MIFHRCIITQNPGKPWSLSCQECSFAITCSTLLLAEETASHHFWNARRAAA